MDDRERYEQGRAVFEACYGDVLAMPERTEDMESYGGVMMRSLFNDAWGRPGLGYRERRLAVLGALIGMGADLSLFEIHAKSALRNEEIAPDELREVALTLVYYCGYGRASRVPGLVERCIAESADQRSAD